MVFLPPAHTTFSIIERNGLQTEGGGGIGNSPPPPTTGLFVKVSPGIIYFLFSIERIQCLAQQLGDLFPVRFGKWSDVFSNVADCDLTSKSL